MIETSIIIPVYNKWELTRRCLKSIAANTDISRIEVIVIDNASSDETLQGCVFLGQRLFGGSFRYIRNEVNRNFAGASNQGADAARGEYLIFLNNDTEVQQGWYAPLISDFSEFPDVAATGPLLLYPEETLFGRTVQHLGVFISPAFALGHLYQGIPARSPLARKRRFFQAITAACMAIKRSLFLGAGQFDERFVNGFEDVDFCARLKKEGYRFTVNPGSEVVHYESQTPGRHAREEENSRLLADGSLNFISPDWHLHAQADGMYLGVTDWLLYQNMIPEKTLRKLSTLAHAAGREALEELVVAYPYWQGGWEKILAMTNNEEERLSVFYSFMKLFKNAENAFKAYELGKKICDRKLCKYGRDLMRSFAVSPHQYLLLACSVADHCLETGQENMARRHIDWTRQFNDFTKNIYTPFARNYISLASETKIPMITQDDNAYAVWTFGKKQPSLPALAETTGFSLLMPVYDPDPEYFRGVLDSVLAQEYGNWELCIADDASTDPRIAEIIREYQQKDPRIRAVFRESNGHIAEATNSALAMAKKEWSVLVDHDDLLTPDALVIMNRHILANPEGMLFYSDEDKVAGDNDYFQPYFKKNKWDMELLASQNFVCHLAVYRTERLKEIGGFRKGFEGAQDHDMLLRYAAGLEAKKIVHISRILYHWRVHDKSTAQDIEAKGYAFENSVKAVSEWLDAASPGASVNNRDSLTQWPRVCYPLPADKHLVSLVCRIPNKGFDRRPVSAAVARSANYPHEIIFVSDDAESGLAVSENEAVTNAKGDIIGFLDSGFVEANENWLRELVSALWRNGVGAVGGKSLVRGELMAHAGYLTDATGLLQPLFTLSPATKAKYFGWNVLQGTVDALDGLCMLTRKQTLLENGLLSTEMPGWAIQDYCLRIGEKGLRSVWWPYARLNFREWSPIPVPDVFKDAWLGRLVPFNENVVIEKGELALCTD